jgi:serine/threonine-protein kinase PknK
LTSQPFLGQEVPVNPLVNRLSTERPHVALIGRSEDLAAVETRLIRDDVRLLTLTGVAGVGKTRLAQAVLNEMRARFAEVILVDLSPLHEPTQVLPAVAHACGVLEGVPGPLSQRLAQAIGSRRLLIVLDNCEQVIEGMTELGGLLGVCPNLKLLATSQEILRLRSEWVFHVAPLQVPEPRTLPGLDVLAQVPSVALFLQRAQAGAGGLRLTAENAHAIAQLCVRLDGLPLAIELVATHAAATCEPHTLLEGLTQRLSIASGARDTPPRQRTLRAALDWSCFRLSRAEKDLFCRLSVFSGWWTLQAAVGVCADGDQLAANEVSPLLDSLASRSLVVARKNPDGTKSYRLLDTIREYAIEHLSGSGREESFRRKHRDYLLAWAEQAEPNAWGPRMAQWLDDIEADFSNFRAALEWSRTPGEEAAGLRLWAALARFFDLRGHVTEGLAIADDLLRLAPGHTPARAMTLLQVSTLTRSQGQLERSALLAEECLATANELGEVLCTAGALMTLGSLAHIMGDLQKAEALFHEAVAVARSHQEREPRALYIALYWLAVFFAMAGSNERAIPASEEALALARRQGDVSFIGVSLAALGRALVGKRDIARAIPVLDEGIRVSRTLDYYELTAYLLDFRGQAACAQKESARAVRFIAAAAALRARIGLITWLPDPDHPRVVAELGEEPIRAARETASDFSPEETIAWALGKDTTRPKPAFRDVQDEAPSPLKQLTAREQEVAALVTDGLANRQIAERLYVSKRTVDAHIRNVLEKLELHNRAQIAVWFIQHRDCSG